MTDEPAAIEAQLVDMRNVGSQKSLKLTLHVPEELALKAIDVFGWPTGAHPVRVAIAALNPEVPATAIDTKPSPPMPPARATPSKQPENKACQRLGIKCHEPPFWAFLQECGITQRFVKSEEGAALAIREHFGVQSRNEIWEDNPKYIALMARYEAWLRAPGVVPV